MKAEILYEAMGEIGDDLILDAEENPAQRQRPLLKPLIAACLAVALLALPVSAEMRNGYVSNLLAPVYGGAQTELVDKIGVPIGASVTDGGYTLTAEAIIGDRYSFAAVYTLKRTDGGKIPEGTTVAQWERGLVSGGGGILSRILSLLGGGGGSGGGILSHQLSEDGTTLIIVEQWTSSRQLYFTNRTVEVTFQDLERKGEDGERTVFAEGTWTLKYTLRYEDTTVEVPVRNLTLTTEEGYTYKIKKILLSSVGIHIDMETPNPDTAGMTIEDWIRFPGFTVSVKLTDGTVTELTGGNRGGHGSEDKTVYDADYGNTFAVPIPLDQIEAIILCGTVIPMR